MSPAMVVGVSDTLHDAKGIVGPADARASRPGPRDTRRKISD